MQVNKSELKSLQATILVAMLASLAACKSTEDQQSPGISPINNTKEIEPKKEISEIPIHPNEQIELSKKDLAQRLGVPADSVVLSGARRVTWRSGALGCPEPGMNYTEALVPGTVIFLQVDNMIHAYHAKFGSKPFYCPRERVEQPLIGEGEDLT